MPLRQWIESANCAIEGVLHAARTQRHIRYHFYAAGLVLVGSYLLGVTKLEFLAIALAVIIVLVAETINSSIEAVVDLLSPEHNVKAREAKDIAAGAVLITAFGAVVVGYIVLLPYLMRLFSSGISIAPRPGEEVAALSFIIVVILVVLLKAYTGKGHPLSGGMPSGHAAISFSVVVSIASITRSFIVTVLAFGLALLIAQSRITTRVHSPLEVIAGALLGAGVTGGLFWVFH